MYQSNNQHSCFDWFIYGNDLAKVRLLLPALLCIMVQTTLALAKIWYLFDNAKKTWTDIKSIHVFSSLIFNDVIDCVLTLISQSEDYFVILQDESRI